MDDDRTRSLQSEANRLADAARERAAGAFEEIKMTSNQVVDKVRDLIEEGNVRRISLRKGERVLFEIPLTVGVGAGAAALLTSPLLAAVGAVAALVSDITVVIERDEEGEGSESDDSASDSSSDSGSADSGSNSGDASGSDKGKGASGGNASGGDASGNTGGDASGSGSGEKTVGKPSGDA